VASLRSLLGSSHGHDGLLSATPGSRSAVPASGHILGRLVTGELVHIRPETFRV